MRTLIAGGAGFIGSHLVDLLLAAGHEVVVVDDVSTGSAGNLPQSERLSVLRVDVAETPSDAYERIYQLASPASPEAYGRAQVATLMTNARGTERLLELAQGCGARFLLASTSEVYGDPLQHPQNEGYWGNVDPVGPRSAYDEGKRFAEALTVAYMREHGVDVRIARIFNTYGPRMRADDGRMPAAFIIAALLGEPIRVHGDGSQTRSLCYVRDTVAGLVAVMERGRAGEVYNIGRADEVSVLAFARRTRRLASSPSPIVFVPARPQDVRRRRPDCRKAEGELHWRAETSLDEGLSETIAWYRATVLPLIAPSSAWSSVASRPAEAPDQASGQAEAERHDEPDQHGAERSHVRSVPVVSPAPSPLAAEGSRLDGEGSTSRPIPFGEGTRIEDSVRGCGPRTRSVLVGESGQVLDYALIVTAIIVLVIAAVSLTGSRLTVMFSDIATKLP